MKQTFTTLILSISFPIVSFCQDVKPNNLPSNRIETGTVLDSTFLDKMRSRNELHSRQFIGSPYPVFSIETPYGDEIRNRDLEGKTTVFYFAYQDCNCYDLKLLELLRSRQADNTSFQLFFVSSQRDGLMEFEKEHQLHTAYVAHGEQGLKTLSFGNGFPSMVIINKSGIVVDVIGFTHFLKNEEIVKRVEGFL
jgi:hypothetical protein